MDINKMKTSEFIAELEDAVHDFVESSVRQGYYNPEEISTKFCKENSHVERLHFHKVLELVKKEIEQY